MKWIFENRVYSSLEELSGKTMSDDNKPYCVFTKSELIDYASHYVKLFRDDVLKLMTNFKKVDVGEGAESESEL